MSGCSFTSNSAGFDGGGIYISGTATVSGSTFTGNSAGDGGGIYNSGTATVRGSTFTGNSARDDGGGIFIGDGERQHLHRQLRRLRRRRHLHELGGTLIDGGDNNITGNSPDDIS